MKVLTHQSIQTELRSDMGKNSSLKLELHGNRHAIGFIEEVMRAVIDSCEKEWEKHEGK